MTTEDSDIVECPKCNLPFPMSKMHEHYQNCKGKQKPVENIYTKPQSYDDFLKSVTAPQAPIAPTAPLPPPTYVEPQRIIKEEKIKPSFCKKCGTQLIESDMFRVCPKDKIIKVKMKMWWWIILRYGLLIGWVAYALGAFTVIGLYHR